MWLLSLLALVATASAQIPSLGWCPDYQPMLNFNMNQFLGAWYEAERYFTITEVGSRCVTTKYESTPEGRILVSNEITNSLTGMKRVMDGSLQMIGREGEGRLLVKYSAVPLPYENEYLILSTDYDNYALMWSCSGIGPVHTQNAWILTRERIAPTMVMQKAYAALDTFKLSRAFFVKTNQADCNVLPDPAATPNTDVIYAKNAIPQAIVEEKVSQVVNEQAVEQKVEAEVKSDVIPKERTAIAELPEEPSKPLQVPELIMSESEKVEEKLEKVEEPLKDEIKLDDDKEKKPEEKLSL